MHVIYTATVRANQSFLFTISYILNKKETESIKIHDKYINLWRHIGPNFVVCDMYRCVAPSSNWISVITFHQIDGRSQIQKKKHGNL